MSGFPTCRELFNGRSSVMMIAWLALIAILIIPVESRKQTVKPWENSRLPKNVVPRHYTITVKPEFYTKKEASFTGSVKIEMEMVNRTNFIILHIKDISIIRSRLFFNATNKVVPTKKPFPYPKNDFWVLPVATQLSKGFYRLELSYTGIILSKPSGELGVLKARYNDPKTKIKRYLIYTAHDPDGARKTFPCFDEPAMKAQFTVKIIHKNTDGYFALSNMPQESTKLHNESGYNITTFARSVLMSTFTVGFSVNDFVPTKAVTKGNVELRVFIPRQQENQMNNLTDNILETNVKALEFFEDYFDIPYALPKLDNLVIKRNSWFKEGSWGLMTFASRVLPYTQTRGSEVEFPKFRVHYYVSYEIAQQWFSNLVTVDWWNDDGWLKNGFSTFFSIRATKFINSSWKMNAFALSKIKDVAMQKDSYYDSLPAGVARLSPNRPKQGVIIFMLEDWLGKKNFTRGIQLFVKKFKFSNAKTSQLWEVLSQVSGNLPYPLPEIMDAWVQQKGFPVISISDANPPAISQEWRIFDADKDTKATISTFKWLLKLDYKSSGTPKQGSIWINGTDKFKLPINVKLSRNDSWILLNAGIGYGYYRVNYPVSFWKKLPKFIERGIMPTTPFERATLLKDAFYFASVGDISYEVLLPMLKMLKNETNFMVWYRVIGDIAYLIKRFQGLPFEKKMKKYFRGIMTNIYTEIPLRKVDDPNTGALQRKVTLVACSTGIPRCREDMLRLFNRYKKGNKTPVSLLGPMLRYGWLENMDSKYNWLSFAKAYRKAKHLDAQNGYWNAFFSSSNATFIEKFLLRILNSSKALSYFKLYIRCAPWVKTWQWLAYWKFFIKNWSKITRVYANITSTQAYILRIVTKYLNTESQLQELKGLLKRYPVPDADSIVKRVKTRLRWIKSRGQAISAWLNANVVD